MMEKLNGRSETLNNRRAISASCAEGAKLIDLLYGSFIVRPEPENFYALLLFVYLVNHSMLDVDTA